MCDLYFDDVATSVRLTDPVQWRRPWLAHTQSSEDSSTKSVVWEYKDVPNGVETLDLKRQLVMPSVPTERLRAARLKRIRTYVKTS